MAEDTALTETATVRFPDDLAAAAKRLAGQDGMSTSAWIRRIVDRELAARSGRCPTCRRPTAEASGSPQPVPAPDDTGREPPTAHESAQERTGPVPPDHREPLGRLVRETWVAWAMEQPAPKPSWLAGWDELDDGQREVDMRIGSAVAARALAGYESERTELTLARLSRSVKLARIAALCRTRPDQVTAEDVLRIIGGEGDPRA